MQNKILNCIVVVSVMICMAFGLKNHPIFISVTEIDYNSKNKSLEISCKIFTDDFEKTLKNKYKTKIDLLAASLKPNMDKLVADYIKNNLQIYTANKICILKYIGYEQIDEAILCYFEVEQVQNFNAITITNTILYEYKKEQTNLIHINVLDKTESKKLLYPNTTWDVKF